MGEFPNISRFELPPRASVAAAACVAALLVLALPLSPAVSPAHSATNEERCNSDIGKAISKLQRSYLAQLGRCIRFGNYSDCPTDTASITKERNALTRAVTDPSQECSQAVNTDGVPVSAFGPSSCPAAWSGCEASINSLDDLATCLLCVHTGYDAWYRILLDLPDTVPDDKNDRKCIRAADKMTGKAIRTALKVVVKCAKGSVQPFSCPVVDKSINPLKFGKALEKIDRKISRCRDEAGVSGALGSGSRELCRWVVTSTDDLARCLGDVARCVACQAANTTYGQEQDCETFSGVGITCDGEFLEAGSFYVANQGDDTVTFYNPDGSYAQGTLAASSTVVGGSPSALLANWHSSVVYVANKDDGTVTMLDALTGEYANGTLFNSSFVVGSMPSALVADHDRETAYVINQGDNSVTMLDARDGSYLYGTLAASTLGVGLSPVAAALNTTDGILYVVNSGEDTITYIDAVAGDYLYGTLAASSFPTGAGPAGVAWTDSPYPGRVLVTNKIDGTVSVLEAVSGAPWVGTLAESTYAVGDGPGPVAPLRSHFYVANENDNTLVVLSSALPPYVADTAPTGEQPSALVASEAGNKLYLAARASNEATVCDRDSAEDSSFQLGSYPYAVAVNPAANLLYVSDYWADAVTYLDATTGDYMNGTLGNSSFRVGHRPRAVAVNLAANLLYVANHLDDTVTYLDATTGAYMNGTLANSTFLVGGRPFDVAVNPAANLIYVAIDHLCSLGVCYDDTVTYLDATTGAYMNGTLANSSFPVEYDPRAVAVNPAANLLYVFSDFVVTYLDATTGDYMNGTLANSSFPVGVGDTRAAAVNPAANLLYVANWNGDVYENGTVTYLDATTGAPVNGTLANSSFQVEASPTAVAVNPAANLLYVTNRYDDTVTYLDATTGDYMNGTLANASFQVGNGPRAVAVNPAANLIYVTSLGDVGVSYLDATTGDRSGLGEICYPTFQTGNLPSAIAVMNRID